MRRPTSAWSAVMIHRYGGRVSCRPVIQPRLSHPNRVATGMPISRAKVASHHWPGPVAGESDRGGAAAPPDGG